MKKQRPARARLCDGTGWIDTHDCTGAGRNKACPGCTACAKKTSGRAKKASTQVQSRPESQKVEVSVSSIYVVLRLPRVPAELAGFGVPLDERRRPLIPDEARELAAELIAAADVVDLATGRKRPRGAAGRYLCVTGCGDEVNSDGDAPLCDNCSRGIEYVSL